MGLTRRQKLFCERIVKTTDYQSNTDAYIATYHPKGSRRTATANASRVYNRPAVQDYLKELWNEKWNENYRQREAERQQHLTRVIQRVMRR